MEDEPAIADAVNYALGIVEHATTARPLENYRQAVGGRMYPEY